MLVVAPDGRLTLRSDGVRVLTAPQGPKFLVVSVPNKPKILDSTSIFFIAPEQTVCIP